MGKTGWFLKISAIDCINLNTIIENAFGRDPDYADKRPNKNSFHQLVTYATKGERSLNKSGKRF